MDHVSAQLIQGLWELKIDTYFTKVIEDAVVSSLKKIGLQNFAKFGKIDPELQFAKWLYANSVIKK